MIKKTIAKIFKFVSNLAKSLLTKLPNGSNKYNIGSVFQYYSKFIIEKPFHVSDTSEIWSWCSSKTPKWNLQSVIYLYNFFKMSVKLQSSNLFFKKAKNWPILLQTYFFVAINFKSFRNGFSWSTKCIPYRKQYTM